MTDRDALHKNPARVPMTLQAMGDRAAHHEPEHVLGMEGSRLMKKIEKDGIYCDKDGKYFFMAAGDYTERDVEFSHERGSRPKPVPVSEPVPTEQAEEPEAVEPSEEVAEEPAEEERANPSAPENKARKAAPQTKAKAEPKDKD